MANRNDTDDLATFLGFTASTWALVVGLVAATVLFFAYVVEPRVAHQETVVTRQSLAYVTSKQQALRMWRMSWDDLEAQRRRLSDPSLRDGVEAQQRGIVRQMKQDADTIPDDVQPDIKEFLASH